MIDRDEIAKAELVKAARIGNKVFAGMCDEAGNVGSAVLSLAFSISIACVASPKRVPLEHLQEVLEMVYGIVTDAEDSAFDGAEQYGIQ
jgi:hypothetical protein